MAWTISVCLPSGRAAELALERSQTLKEVKVKAQEVLGQKFLQLITEEGTFMDLRQNLDEAGLYHGASVQACVMTPLLHCTRSSFGLQVGHRLVTWGAALLEDHDGWDPPLQENVKEVKCTGLAFAALRTDGSVVCWGHPSFGGTMSVEALAAKAGDRRCTALCATVGAFAALLDDGSVIAWGSPQLGGVIGPDVAPLRDVVRLDATHGAFFATRAEGRTAVWGSWNPEKEVLEKLRDFRAVSGTQYARAVVLADGSILTSGNQAFGGDSSAVREHLKDAQALQASDHAFAAVLGAERRVVTWGHQRYGGDSSHVQLELFDVVQLEATRKAFAARRGDGRVICWGDPNHGGQPDEELQEQLCDVSHVVAGGRGFAALKTDGQVLFWGSRTYSGVALGARRVTTLVGAFGGAWAAVLEGGGLVAWGDPKSGGEVPPEVLELVESL
ncbi:unnamed protein product [Durusdinium trenchii]|uniref:Ubiquitin-like domain-containing protein n=1 Tax=Durusdinium trenchii TaxID=1381693 RepID=A0ABP0SI26_9DINO